MNEEIKILKEEYMMLQNASDKVEEEKDREIERLNNIIDKAIEYITTEQLYTNYQWDKSQYEKILKDLLEILKGVDKE